MKSARFITSAVLLLPVLLAGQAKKKPAVPAAFNHARYAWVEAENGDAFTPGLLTEDRQAIANVEDALQAWNRYSLTTGRREAELVFIVRKGRLASATIGGTVGVGTGPSIQPGPGQRPGSGTAGTNVGGVVKGEVGPPDDILEVRQVDGNGKLGIVLWERSFPNGLDTPHVALMAQLKKAVEHDYPLNPPPTKP